MSSERSVEFGGSEGATTECEAQLGHRQLRDTIKTRSEIDSYGVMVWI